MLGHFWGEVVHTAIFLLNRVPTSMLDGMTPYQAWHGKKPPIHFLKVFDSMVYIKRVCPHLANLNDCRLKVVFIGYHDGSKAYRFYDPIAEHVHVSCDAIFDEDVRWDWGASLDASCEQPFMVTDHCVLSWQRVEALDQEEPSPEQQSLPVRSTSPGAGSTQGCQQQPTMSSVSPVVRSPPQGTSVPSMPAHARTRIEFVTPLTTYPNLDTNDGEEGEHRYRTLDHILGMDAAPRMVHHDDVEAELHNINHAMSVKEPKLVKEVDSDPNWVAVMEDEMKSIRDNQTWSLVELP